MIKNIAFDDPSPPCTTEDFTAFVHEFGMLPGRVFRKFCEMCRGGGFVLRDVTFLPPQSHVDFHREFAITEERILMSDLYSIHRENDRYSTFRKTAYIRKFQSLFPEDTRIFIIGSDPLGNSLLANIFYNDPRVILWERESGKSYSVSESLEAFYNGLSDC